MLEQVFVCFVDITVSKWRWFYCARNISRKIQRIRKKSRNLDKESLLSMELYTQRQALKTKCKTRLDGSWQLKTQESHIRKLCIGTGTVLCVKSSVSDPDWIRIQSGQWIREKCLLSTIRTTYCKHIMNMFKELSKFKKTGELNPD
jgi:hypothetical protein